MARRVMALAWAVALGSTAATAAPLLHPMFQDHAVLQRDGPIPVYGWARPGATVSVTLAGATAQARADKDGRWRLSLAARPAGGPHVLEARSEGAVETAKDVLIGDVFLCAGQSNMQLAVRAAADAQMEMRAATDGQIRQLGVATTDSAVPLERFATPVVWTAASPETVGAFSASCYYFARELKKTTKAPIGMVVSAWGGSRVRNWVSEAGLAKLGYFDEDLAMADLHRKDPEAALRRWDAAWEGWWKANGAAAAGGDPWDPSYPVASWATAPAGLGPWALWTGSSPDGFVGQMWLRTTVTLTAAQAAQPAVLDLGAVNEEDESWVNGHGVGGTSWAKEARHAIPAGVLRAGVNTIVTNIFCSWRNCGMSGPADARAIRLKDGSAVPLDQPWRYSAMPDGVIAPQLPWGPTHGVARDYNGMIAPIGPYGFRGVVWYQGESDIYFSGQYERTMAALMADWRGQFGAGLPFLIVQIPNYGPRPTRPVESAWSRVREAQRRAADADPRAAYITTVDIGDAANLHPANKQDVGRRLAIAARHLILGEPLAPSGARPVSARRDGDGVLLTFKDVTGALAAYGGDPNAFELCGAGPGTCRYVNAHVETATTIRLRDDRAPASRVRYCWGDSPTCTLTDGSGLPVTPFETGIASGTSAGP